MKVSALIAKLKELKEIYGDVDVYVPYDGHGEELVNDAENVYFVQDGPEKSLRIS